MTGIKVIRVQDKYNPCKVWLVKRYSNGTYYFNQEIKGYAHNKKYQRTTKRHLEDVGIIQGGSYGYK